MVPHPILILCYAIQYGSCVTLFAEAKLITQLLTEDLFTIFTDKTFLDVHK